VVDFKKTADGSEGPLKFNMLTGKVLCTSLYTPVVKTHSLCLYNRCTTNFANFETGD